LPAYARQERKKTAANTMTLSLYHQKQSVNIAAHSIANAVAMEASRPIASRPINQYIHRKVEHAKIALK